MKLFAVVLLAVSAIAEPPVNNRYLPPSQSYGVPGFGGQRQTDAIIRGRPSSSYNAPRRPSTEYGPPSQALSTQYGPPSQAISSQYGPPSQLSNQYLSPSARITQPSTQYGAPNQGFGTDITYATPSQEYGAPGLGSRGSNRISQNRFDSNSGYNSAQNRQYLPPNQSGYGSDDGSNGEPANYSFEYMVKDEPSGNDFGHRESRQGDRAEGLYYVLLPDGRKQTVEYEADQNGYRPKISYQDVGVGAGGYNRNAQGGYSGGGYQY
ncbi:pro-resilin-like [Pieris brassicae]|uniref:pro-resilin-like n=1 Tax=Pieris brassicae TaxID=7116 RepID=UPI001E662935|nr:pro-resilin-like [Pieris brassicae]